MQAQLRQMRVRLSRERDALRMLSPAAKLVAQRARLQAGARALARAMVTGQSQWRAALARLVGRLDSLSPLSVLARGYALVRRTSDSAIPHAATSPRVVMASTMPNSRCSSKRSCRNWTMALASVAAETMPVEITIQPRSTAAKDTLGREFDDSIAESSEDWMKRHLPERE